MRQIKTFFLLASVTIASSTWAEGMTVTNTTVTHAQYADASITTRTSEIVLPSQGAKTEERNKRRDEFIKMRQQMKPLNDKYLSQNTKVQ